MLRTGHRSTEPQLPEILESAGAKGGPRFSTDIAQAAGSRVHFLAVGTPQRANGNAADLSAVHAAVDALIPHLQPGDRVVGESTGCRSEPRPDWPSGSPRAVPV